MDIINILIKSYLIFLFKMNFNFLNMQNKPIFHYMNTVLNYKDGILEYFDLILN